MLSEILINQILISVVNILCSFQKYSFSLKWKFICDAVTKINYYIIVPEITTCSPCIYVTQNIITRAGLIPRVQCAQ